MPTTYIVHNREDLGKGFNLEIAFIPGGSFNLEMAYIPGGSFIMGSSDTEAYKGLVEGPPHKVTLKPFYMSKNLVTQEQYQAIRGDNPSYFQGKNRPVEKVSWFDVNCFCSMLSKVTGDEYRLPSESQWEYACRAGTTTPFNCGKIITTKLANYDGDFSYGVCQGTTSVGEFPPNKLGLYDMHGNVWEWCADDWHDNYEKAPTDGSAWVDNYKIPVDRSIVLRGGSWVSPSSNVRSASRRDWHTDVGVSSNIGFRIVCVSPQDY